MKFFETMTGDFVNIDDISKICYELDEQWLNRYKEDKYYSYIYLKNGDKLDFLDLPSKFMDKNEIDHDFNSESDLILSYIRQAVKILVDYKFSSNFIDHDTLSDLAWEQFINEYNSKIF